MTIRLNQPFGTMTDAQREECLKWVNAHGHSADMAALYASNMDDLAPEDADYGDTFMLVDPMDGGPLYTHCRTLRDARNVLGY